MGVDITDNGGLCVRIALHNAGPVQFAGRFRQKVVLRCP